LEKNVFCFFKVFVGFSVSLQRRPDTKWWHRKNIPCTIRRITPFYNKTHKSRL